jgi:hypothetical protein
MTAMPHRLDRTVVMRASRETVFRFFTETISRISGVSGST